LALEVFAYEMKRYIGAYFAVLGGLDAVAFTGGAGENAPAMRARICAGLGHLGIELDVVRNRVQHEEAIVSTEASKVSIAVVPANEELIIARETMGLLWGREGNS
jgi:acetate kinase